jgi:hypothetical protein
MAFIMGKPVSAVPLPPELQRELPAGALVFSFDGEMVFRCKNPNHNQEPRTFSLLPVTDNELMYERRWPGQPLQDTYLSVEHFHGHIVTMFFFYFPIPKSTTSQLSEKFLPMVKAAAKNSPITEELYAAAEKIIPSKVSENGPLYRTSGFAAMSWSTHQWVWVTSPDAAGFVFEGALPLGKAILMNKRARYRRNDEYAATLDRLVTHFRYETNKKLQQGNADGGRL